MNRPLVVLDHVTIQRTGRDVLRDFSWTICAGETWAVAGPVGSGKTTLAETVLGKHFARSGSVSWPMLDGRPGLYPSSVIRHVAFQEQSRLFSYAGHYYQQRFEFADADEPLTLEQFLGPNCSHVARQLGIEAQLPLSFMKLSNGQTRRARIAQALLANPELLILDDPFLGVDACGRVEIAEILGGLVKQGLRLILICSPDAVPSWVTHRLELHREGRFVTKPSSHKNGSAGSAGASPSQEVVELRNVSVAHGGRTILKDINWTVRAGDRWAVFGPNGSGKTTLLSLLCGDHPQAYSNDVKLFGRRRGTGESIWDVKRRIGLLSPEFHLYFSEPLNAERVAATGFFDGVADRPTTPEQNRAVMELFTEFRLTHLVGRPFRQLSTGEQRLVLLVRALVKRPELLILDEPFQSLDSAAMRHARDWLDRRLGPEQTLLFVSHFEDELPACIGHRLNLS
ncbi:MAG: ATP-binding cassette domain-containing protein [Gemmataceae bacterium]